VLNVDAGSGDICTVGAGGTLSIPPELAEQVRVERKEARPQTEWGLVIAGYLYLGGLGAGAFLLAVVLDWLGFRLPALTAAWSGSGVDWAAFWTLWGPLVVAFGAALLIVHLGRNWRLFFTACFNPRGSWLARGFLILTAFILVGVACLALSIFAPDWVAEGGAAWRTLQAIGVAFAFATAAYTGLLLRSMKYIPAWRTMALPTLFVVSALSCGAMALALTVMIHGLLAGVAGLNEATLHALSNIERVLLPLELVVLAVYVRVLQRGRPEAALSARMLLHGERRAAFWVLVVAVGLLFPLSLEIAYAFAPGAPAVPAVGAVAVLIGGLVLRHLVLAVGVKEQAPLVRASDWRGGAALARSPS
jgi:formate-dependent nitrite reductase membrane component NrfD